MSELNFYLLQINDALFPIGAYSHSQGLETYIQRGIVHDEATAKEYIHHKIRWNLAFTELLAARLSYLAAAYGDLEQLLSIEEILEASRIPMEHCCIYGVFCAAMNIPLADALSHYLYAQTSAIVTNCVKTIPLSQSAGQQLLGGCYAEFAEILKDLEHRSAEDLCLSAPGFDIRGIQHETLYSRLYMS